MRIGVVFHGPEVIDTGKASFILAFLREKGEVEVRLGGTMGAAAIMDAGMGAEIEVRRELVSEALSDMSRYLDTLYLASCSKTRKSGLSFGRIAVGRARIEPRCPLVQIDDGFVVAWNEKGKRIAKEDAVAIKHDLIDCARKSEKDETGWRRVHGVQAGENVWINGIVVGRALSDEVWVGEESGNLALRGIEIKQHGLEKLRSVEPAKAVIRSGSVRRTVAGSRIARLEGGNKVIFVDHDAESSFFRARGAKAAVTVGDDTTCIAASLLYRFGTPVIGIVDGDEDGICKERLASPGSTIITLRSGNDDIVGAVVKKEIFGGREDLESSVDVKGLVEKITKLCDNLIRNIRVY